MLSSLFEFEVVNMVFWIDTLTSNSVGSC